MVEKFNEDEIEVEIFDSIISIAILEQSMAHLGGRTMSLFGSLPDSLLSSLSNSMLSMTEYDGISEFFKPCPKDDPKIAAKRLHLEVINFCL